MNSDGRSYADFIADGQRSCAVIAHRGIWRDAPENSLLAIERAMSAGADGVEIDVKRTADGEFVLLHDDTLERMAGIDQPPEALELATISRLKLRNRDGGAGNGPTDENLPTLIDFFSLIRGKIFVHLDVKDRNLIPEVMACARKMGVQDQVDYWSDLRTQQDMLWVRRFIDLRNTLFIAKTRLNTPDAEEQLRLLFQLSPQLCEVYFDDLHQIGDLARKCESAEIKLWYNTLDSVSCAGFSDSAALEDPENIWGRLIDAGISVIQTDETEALKTFIANRDRGHAV